MKKGIIILIIAVVIGAGVYYYTSSPTASVPAAAPAVAPVAPAATSTVPTSIVPPPYAKPFPGTTTPQASAVTVSIKGFAFVPAYLKVAVGTKVTWVNDDNVSHTITSDSGKLLDSPTLSPGQSFTVTFTEPGTESYHCAIHTAMTGKVFVE